MDDAQPDAIIEKKNRLKICTRFSSFIYFPEVFLFSFIFDDNKTRGTCNHYLQANNKER